VVVVLGMWYVDRNARNASKKLDSLGVYEMEDERVNIAFWRLLDVEGSVRVYYGIHALGTKSVKLSTLRETPVRSVHWR
jgi:hypothetical protein